MTKFSVVMPIHNEEAFLPYSLPSILRLHPNAVILLFDHCTDYSQKVAKEVLAHTDVNVRIVEVNESCDWNCRIAWLRRLGYRMAKNDIILTTDADIILDRRIVGYIKLINNNIKLLVFDWIDFPVTYQNTVVRLMQKTPFNKFYTQFSGVCAFSRQAWLETENLEHIKQIERAEDAHLQLAITRKYSMRFITTNTIHLRPKETGATHYRKGRLYWRVAHRSMILVLVSGIILLRPLQIRGYIHERFG